MSSGPARKPGYDLLILPDGGAARKMRLTSARLSFYKFCLGLLLVLAGGGVSATWFLTAESLRTTELLRQTQKDLVGTKAQIERLGNIDELLRGADPERIAEKLKALDEMAKQPTQPAGDGPVEGDAENEADDCPKIDLTELFATVSAGADVANVKIRFEPARGFVTTFDVSNAEPKNPISGVVGAQALLRDGSTIPLSAPREELAFSINRLKAFSTVLALPKDVDRSKCFALILEITSQAGKKLYHGLTILPRE